MFNKLNFNTQLYIASKILNISKEKLLVDGFDITDSMNSIAKEYLIDHRPLSKIFNEKYFWKNCFYTNEYTLDPRPETEKLIELVISHKHNNISLLELGVGTGAIILTLIKEIPLCKATGIDISTEALQVCEKNAKNMNLKINLYKNNWLDNIDEHFDILVSNPPYLLEEEINENYDVLKHDPKIALYGGQDGLLFYKSIAQKQHLFKYIYLEVPPIRQSEVKQLFKYHKNTHII